MRITYDPAKDEANSHKHGVSLERATEFEWSTAGIIEDARREYSEQRFIAVGYLNNRLHVLCFTPIAGGIRVISFRKANAREASRYGRPLTID